MKRKDAIRMFFRSILTKFGQVETDNGILYFDGEEIEVGTKVQVEDASAEDLISYVDAPDGEYKVGDITYTVEGSVVTAIDKPEEAETETVETVETEMEGETPDVTEDAANLVSEVADEAKPEFDAEEAYKALMITMAELTGRVDSLQESVSALLVQPGAEPVFAQYSKVNKVNQPKSIFKVNR